MRKPKSFDRAVAFWCFGWLPSNELPAVAVNVLEHGIESPSLIRLASAETNGDPDYHRIFEKALSELGCPRLSKQEAGRMIARHYAMKISNHELKPIEGARLIWRILLECPELTPDLGIFAGRVTEYEDCPPNRDGIERMIRLEAEALLH